MKAPARGAIVDAIASAVRIALAHRPQPLATPPPASVPQLTGPGLRDAAPAAEALTVELHFHL